MQLEFYTHAKMHNWQHAFIKWVEEGRWFNLHERMIPTQDAKFHSTKLMLNEIGPFSANSVKGFTKIDVPARCPLADVENAIRVWNDALQHPEKGKVLWKQEGAAVEVKPVPALVVREVPSLNAARHANQ